MNQDLLVKEMKRKNTGSNLLIAVGAVLDLVPRFLTIHMAASFIAGQLTWRTIGLAGGLMLLSMVLKSGCFYFSTWMAHKAAYTTLTDLRLRLIRHLKKLPIRFFQERKTGGLTSIIEHDVEQAEFYLAHGLPEIMTATVVPAVLFITMLLIDWRLALLMVSTLPLMLLTRKLSAAIWKKNQQTFSESTKTMQENVLEYVQTIAVIKAFGKEETKTERTIQFAKDYVRAARKAAAGVSVSMGILDVFMQGGVVLMMIAGSLFLATGELSVPMFVLSILLGTAFTSFIAKAATLQHYGIVFSSSMKEVASVLDAPIAEAKEVLTNITHGDIEISSLYFAYPGKETTLNNISVTFPQGSRSALVGASGCGKSTLVSLLIGFWQPPRGSIKIGGVDVTDLSESELNALIGIVQQDAFLFNMSIAENIRMGKPSASEDEIIAAAKKARIHDFIQSLPEGYQTKAGESGVKFSGGEKQRVAIARMILKDTPILIFDEATAAVDAENEKHIHAAIEEFSRNKTVITITHHLNTIRGAEQIIVMETGQVVGIGTHSELTARCPQYGELISQQDKVDRWNIKEGCV
ncbi:ABC transporter ATP-binding protein [Lacrimispora sp. BS-2]|uniref:ABC transporter ATP-binding protein n=1 Tax=Lacrimispora sp. BS-2 TaxID=3151850 RepID=A0AAU7PNL8_9FIRM